VSDIVKKSRDPKTLMPNEVHLQLNSSLLSSISGLMRHFSLQALGRDGIQTKVREAFESSELVWKKISKYPCLRRLVSEKVT
jgi:hypothetical protein